MPLSHLPELQRTVERFASAFKLAHGAELVLTVSKS